MGLFWDVFFRGGWPGSVNGKMTACSGSVGVGVMTVLVQDEATLVGAHK